jgi:hypothetical protein
MSRSHVIPNTEKQHVVRLSGNAETDREDAAPEWCYVEGIRRAKQECLR